MSGSSLRPVGVEELRRLVARLSVPSPAATDAERVDRVRALEEIKNAAAAAQARESVAFDVSQREDQRLAGVPEARVGRGVGDQIALARRVSPHQGSRLLGLAKALVRDLPECLAALERGEVSEFRVGLVARETSHLRPEDRMVIDAELGPKLKDLGDRAAAGRARARAQRLDVVGAVARLRRAENERTVTIRPAPDSMTYVTALLPMRDGVAVYAALEQIAKEALVRTEKKALVRTEPDEPGTCEGALTASGQPGPTAGRGAAGPTAPAGAATQPRGKGALMADALVERVTGRAVGTVPISLQLVMTDTALVGADDTPTRVGGHGTIPTEVARMWMRQLIARTQVVDISELIAINRLFTSPDGRDLVAMESPRRGFSGLLRSMLGLRDHSRCRTPYCEATAADMDHIHRVEEGGTTRYCNGRGACRRCNLAREAPGWELAVVSCTGESHAVRTTTPTGHSYDSTAPPLLPGRAEPTRPAAAEESPARWRPPSRAEAALAAMVASRGGPVTPRAG